MKLFQLQEASYHSQSEWVDWVRHQFEKVGPHPEDDKICLGNEREVPVEELGNIINDLTKAFGKPKKEDPYKDLHHQWVWRVNRFIIKVFPWGVGDRASGICVGTEQLQEAKYANTDPMIDMIADMIRKVANDSEHYVERYVEDPMDDVVDKISSQFGEPIRSVSSEYEPRKQRVHWHGKGFQIIALGYENDDDDGVWIVVEQNNET